MKGQYCLMNIILPVPKFSSDKKHKSLQVKNPIQELSYSQLGDAFSSLDKMNGTIYRMGICIPSQCSAHEIQQLLNTRMF